MTVDIAGAVGFGRESLDALRAMSPPGGQPVVFLDDHAARAEVDGVPVRRPEEAGPGEFVVAIADPVARQRLAVALTAAGLTPGRLVHPRAVISAGASLAPGCVVLANAFVSTAAVLGAHVHVNYLASVGHDAVLHDFVTVLPGANIAGGVRLGPGATIGSNACVLPGLVAGVPARPLR